MSSDTIVNPVIAGFAPDPSLLRVGNEYFLATSTFGWLPGIRLYTSSDLAEWTLVGHALDSPPALRGTGSSAGVWAPSLSYDPATSTICLTYSVMWSQNAEVFDVDNFLVTAPDIRGPWSEPIYLNSVGFDPSMFHDDDGRHWVVTLEWETREGYEHPGAIVLEQYDWTEQRLIGAARRISRGSTDRGCLEGPNLSKHNGLYYLMTAEGGTGFGHGVALARSARIEGPYESSPVNPIVTSAPDDYFDRNNRDYLRPERFNPRSGIQKAGHGCLVDTPDGEWYLAHLASRPLPDSRRSMLGRETFVQKVEWTDNGWVRMVDGGRLARDRVPGISGLSYAAKTSADNSFDEDFEGNTLALRFSSIRTPVSDDWARLGERPGHLRLRGRQALTSRFDVSLIATPLQAVTATATAVLEFTPAHFSQSAGLVLYYDELNHLYLRVTRSESLGSRVVAIDVVERGVRRELRNDRRAIGDGPVTLQAQLREGVLQFRAGVAGEELADIGPALDATILSDETALGFTGTMVGVVCQDGFRRRLWADIDSFAVTY
ncbi:MAG: family 43 glycosylhydrolase [Actinomycetota bacterium]|nr:family 43 glycosylhydrolase [Actinomycetota bacterium]